MALLEGVTWQGKVLRDGEWTDGRGGTYAEPGHTGYPNKCMFVFDPEFEAFADEYAKQLADTKDDPYLLGHFTDNELPFPKDALDRFLQLPDADPGRQAAATWFTEQAGRPAPRVLVEPDARDPAG